jgi:hypothetical protein
MYSVYLNPVCHPFNLVSQNEINLTSIFIPCSFAWFFCEKKQDKTVLDEREPKGEMDLTNWDFQKQGYKKLDGNWRFYWKELRPPEDALLEVTYSHYPYNQSSRLLE